MLGSIGRRARCSIDASDGFFIAGKDSIVVPLRYLQVNRARSSFFLRMSSAQAKTVPLMPTICGSQTRNARDERRDLPKPDPRSRSV